MSLEIKEVQSAKELKAFVEFSLKLYKKNPCYVPSLTFDEINTFNPKKNPAFDFCESTRFVAIRNGEIVGRIAGIINHEVNDFWKQNHARFGWFDVINDQEVTEALLESVKTWAKAKGMNALKGPLGFTDLDHEGMLVEGFEEMGTFATIYNNPYYPRHFENLGYRKDVDWKEYQITLPDSIPERYTRMAVIVSTKYELRTVKFKKSGDLIKAYGEKIFKLWNDTYKVLYGFAPLTDKQVQYYIKMYLSFVRPDLVSVIVDKDDNVVGMGIAIPSLSKAFQKAKGKILPFGFIYLLNALRKNDIVDLYLMGIHPDYQGKGLNSMIFADLVPIFIKNGYKLAETNPELEENGRIQQLWSDFNPRQHRRRRVYIKEF
ncbi:MAG TPA: N-acetyltransferase [Bacteroidales bacterium]